VAFGHGTTNAFDEAAWLVMWGLKLPLDALDDHAHQAQAPGDAHALKRCWTNASARGCQRPT
jgi:ribosomal protein L3 glutamine methyltransferase